MGRFSETISDTGNRSGAASVRQSIGWLTERYDNSLQRLVWPSTAGSMIDTWMARSMDSRPGRLCVVKSKQLKYDDTLAAASNPPVSMHQNCVLIGAFLVLERDKCNIRGRRLHC